jgi:(2Fe-2S) ferredoxin
VNKAGCLDRCEQGVSCVIYPDGIWYTIPDDDAAIARIVEHLAGGKPASEFRMGE